MPQFIGKTIGGYRIIEQIGVGGMATVFKAYQPSMERYVAFKVISTYLANDPTFIKRFDQEAKVIARLEHAHILPVYDYGEVDGYLYLVMRFIEGGTLKDRLKDEPLTLTEARRVVNQIGSALEYTHQLNVVHRDLKPSNVLIDAQGDCYLTDFGIAKMVESSAGLTGSGIVGTPHYMSPEQSKTNKVDRRADIYAMGVVIYEMLTGQVPFDAETPVAVLLKHITEPLPLPRSIKPDLPEAVERVILKALAKEPADRYQSMRDLVIAFDEAVQTAPTKLRTITSPAPPVLMMVVESGPAPASGWRRYFPWLLAVTGLVLVGLALAGGLALLWRPGSTGPNPQTETALAIITTPATPVTIPSTSGPTETQPATFEPAEVQPATSTPLIPTPTATFIPPTPTVLPTPTTAPTLSPAPVVSPTPTPTPSPTSPPPDTATPAPPSPTPPPPLQLQVSQLALYEESAGNIIWLPDSQRLVIDGHKIVQYDGQTWQQAQELDREIARSTSLSSDGSMLAASFYESVKVWDTTGWGELVALDGSKNTEQVAFSPDGQLLATTTGGTVKLWEAATGAELRTLPAGSSAGPLAFSPDGRTLAAMGGVAGGEIKVWDTATWNEVRSIKGHSNWIKSIAFAPDGKTLASGSVDNSVRLWDVASGRQLRAFMGHTNQVESVAFSPDGRLLASASWDLTVRLWDVASGKELNQLTGHSSQIRCVAFSPDGAMLASGSNDQMRLWRIEIGAKAAEPTPTAGLSAPLPTPVPLSESAISPDNIDQLTQLSTLESDQVGQLAWSPDGKLLAIGTYHFYIYDAQTLAQAHVTDSLQWFRSIDFSPDGSLLATASADGVRLWDTTGWGELRTLAGSKDTEQVAFSPDAKLLATTTGGTVKLWEAASGNELRTLPAGSSAGPLAFSPDGRLLAAMGGVGGGEIKVWDTTSWSELHTLKGHSNWIKSIAFAPDGKTLASGSVDKSVRLWDVATGRQLRVFMGHTGHVECVAFSPDGRLLASASWDLTIRLWDVTLGRELRTLSGHSDPVLSMAFSPDGAILATGGRDTAVRLWSLADKE